MKRSLFAAFAAALLFANLAAAQPFKPNEPIMPLSQVRVGMKGVGKTVFQGSKIVSFPVEILGVINRKERPTTLILIRASGPDIERAGGLADGMSGTPIYVDGKLIGAFSFGWDFGDAKMGMVTPIELMTKLFDYRDRPVKTRDVHPSKPLRNNELMLLDQKFNDIYEKYKSQSANLPGNSTDALSKTKNGVKSAPPARNAASAADPDGDEFARPQDVAAAAADAAAVAARARSPRDFISVSGVSRRAMKGLERKLGTRVVEGGAGDTTAAAPKIANLKPGDAVSALVAWGDVGVDAAGTLTAIDKNGRFIAFGHHFKNWGAVNIPIARATVHSVINSVESPFKLTSAGNIIGMITQDRAEGVAGYFARFAPAVSVRVDIEDRDTGRSSVRRFQMINDEHAVTLLLPELLSGLIDRELGREGGGTIRWDVAVTGRGMPENWAQGDVTSADEGVSSAAMSALAETVSSVIDNPYQNLGTFGLRVKVSASSEKRKLLIQELRVDRGEVRPGEEVSVRVVLHPWRQLPETHTFKLRVPDDASGNYVVSVRAGQTGGDRDGTPPPAADRGMRSFAQYLREIQTRERSSEVVVELINPEEGPDAQGNRRRKILAGTMRVFRSDYVVDGNLQAPVVVSASKTAGRKRSVSTERG